MKASHGKENYTVVGKEWFKLKNLPCRTETDLTELLHLYHSPVKIPPLFHWTFPWLLHLSLVALYARGPNSSFSLRVFLAYSQHICSSYITIEIWFCWSCGIILQNKGSLPFLSLPLPSFLVPSPSLLSPLPILILILNCTFKENQSSLKLEFKLCICTHIYLFSQKPKYFFSLAHTK